MGKRYDIVIVGAGLYGATCARLLTDKGYKCLIVEKNSYVGGMCATKRVHGIDVHLHGPHVFRTKDKEVWDFISKYCKMNSYKHSEIMLCNNRMFSLPIDIRAYNMLFGSINAMNAYKEVKSEIDNYNVAKASSLEDSLVMQYGTSIYSELMKPYYEKKFGRSCSELAVMVPDMQPSYFRLENNLYDTEWQGIPENGYTDMIEKIIGDDIPIVLNKDFVKNLDKMYDLGEVFIYTGPLDRLCKYVYGTLDWTSLEVKQIDESLRGTHIYGNAVTKVADKKNDLLRITEYKWFTPERESDAEWRNHNIVTYEYFKKYEVDTDPYYSINSIESMELYKKYLEYATNKWPNILMGGTKGLYINMSMDETIKSAMNTCKIAVQN